MRGRERRDGRGWERAKERKRLKRHKIRRSGDRIALPGSEKRNDAEVSGGRVRMQSFVQRGRGAE